MQALALLTRCFNSDLVPSDDERGLLLLQLGRHLQDLGQTSLAVQVSFTCENRTLNTIDSQRKSIVLSWSSDFHTITSLRRYLIVVIFILLSIFIIYIIIFGPPAQNRRHECNWLQRRFIR